MPSEGEATTASYLFALFNDIETLNNSFASYSNSLTEVWSKYVAPSIKKDKSEQEVFKAAIRKIGIEEGNTFFNQMQVMRFWSTRSYVKISAMRHDINEFNKHYEEIQESYNKLINEIVPMRSTAERFVISVNTAFVSGVSSELLVKARQTIGELVSDGGANT